MLAQANQVPQTMLSLLR
ncbi:hypothetical protein [Kosakonia cowanii]